MHRDEYIKTSGTLSLAKVETCMEQGFQ
ncbi:hypothetical protein Godav_025812 [Gossypium davidsonii]|uniref:Uncharacterized protein n=1 Tax=Gossypium davidsonii TaxID=34287 RepID=A0A7J8TC59_GOSDV|nr:hypothetical protein [Gossypium davidsonii]